jgi:prepilin-type N-terminal cleavage/methylation domain-containing protein
MNHTYRIAREEGFTIVEVLTTLLVLSALSAIALTNFVGKDKVAMDAEAKSNVRNLFAHVQTCFAEQGDYTLCDQAAEIGNPSGFSWGTGANQVEIRRTGSRTTRTQVTIRGFSKAVTSGRRHSFTFIKRAGPPPDTRTCRTANGNDAGGCNNGSW